MLATSLAWRAGLLADFLILASTWLNALRKSSGFGVVVFSGARTVLDAADITAAFFARAVRLAGDAGLAGATFAVGLFAGGVVISGGELSVLAFAGLAVAAFLGLAVLAAGAVDGGSAAGCFAAVCLFDPLELAAVLAPGILLGARLTATLPWVNPTWRAENPKPVACSIMGA